MKRGYKAYAEYSMFSAGCLLQFQQQYVKLFWRFTEDGKYIEWDECHLRYVLRTKYFVYDTFRDLIDRLWSIALLADILWGLQNTISCFLVRFPRRWREGPSIYLFQVEFVIMLQSRSLESVIDFRKSALEALRDVQFFSEMFSSFQISKISFSRPKSFLVNFI